MDFVQINLHGLVIEPAGEKNNNNMRHREYCISTVYFLSARRSGVCKKYLQDGNRLLQRTVV